MNRIVKYKRLPSDYLPEGERPLWDVVRENLHRYVDESNKTPHKISQDAGFRDATILNRVMKGNGKTGLTGLQQLAKGLGIKTIDLFEDWSE